MAIDDPNDHPDHRPDHRDPSLDYPDGNPRPADAEGPCPVPACECRSTCDPIRHCNLRSAWEADPATHERLRSQSAARPFEERLMETLRFAGEAERGRREWKTLRRRAAEQPLPPLPVGDAAGTFDATVGRR